MDGALHIGLDLPLPAAEAFDAVVRELGSALERLQIDFEGSAAGRIFERGTELGEVTAWEPGRRAAFRWRAATWNPDLVTEFELTVEPIDGGSRVSVEHRGLERLAGSPGELAGWFASQVLAPLVGAASPVAFGDWFTDRYARRPAGAQSELTYADPLYHYPNFRVILEQLALMPNDYLVEIGCGGGAFLKTALATGARAAAIDHSADMVRLARRTNAEAIAAGRLAIVESDAAALPFRDAVFTHAAMTGVLGFLPDPVGVFREIRRVLGPGGRFVGLGSDPELRGTPGAPEPMASRLRFYESADLEAMARAAGFGTVRVLRRDLEQFAREAGVPEAHLPLFAAKPGEGARFLVCHA